MRQRILARAGVVLAAPRPARRCGGDGAAGGAEPAAEAGHESAPAAGRRAGQRVGRQRARRRGGATTSASTGGPCPTGANTGRHRGARDGLDHGGHADRGGADRFGLGRGLRPVVPGLGRRSVAGVDYIAGLSAAGSPAQLAGGTLTAGSPTAADGIDASELPRRRRARSAGCRCFRARRSSASPASSTQATASATAASASDPGHPLSVTVARSHAGGRRRAGPRTEGRPLERSDGSDRDRVLREFGDLHLSRRDDARPVLVGLLVGQDGPDVLGLVELLDRGDRLGLAQLAVSLDRQLVVVEGPDVPAGAVQRVRRALATLATA